jgi:hypothetical protein
MLLAALALWGGFEWWAATRKLVPLDLPVSLSRGHIRTEPFSINLRSGYNLVFALAQAAALYNLECQNGEQCHKSLAMLQTHWVLSSDGKEVASGAAEGTNATSGDQAVLSWPIGLFGSSSRQFRIDADILSDTGALNQGDPRLVVQVDRNGDDWFSELSQIVPIIAGIFGAVGVALLWASRVP